MAIPIATAPVNAVAAATTISAAVIAFFSNGDSVEWDGNVYTYDAASVFANGEFRDATELAAHINALPDWIGAEAAGAVNISGAEPCAHYNGNTFAVNHFVGTTAGGGAGSTGDVTINAARVAALIAGDTVSFNGSTYTMVAAAPGANEFTNQAGLIALIDAEADWAAANNAGDIDISSAANGAIWNGFDVDIVFNRTTASGVDGTPGVAGGICTDMSRIYITTETGGVTNNGWQRTDALNFATY